MKKTYLFSLLLISFLSNGQNLKSVKTSEYEFSYPINLRFDDSKMNNTEFMIFTEKDDINDTFIENINMITQSLKGYQIDLNQYVKISENQIIENGKLIHSKRIKLNNSDAHILSYTANLNGKNLKFFQYLLIKNEKAYIITYTAEINKFDTYFPEIIKIFNSFSLN